MSDKTTKRMSESFKLHTQGCFSVEEMTRLNELFRDLTCIVDEQLEAARSAGEAHGAAKEREKQREYVSSKFIDRQGVYKKFNTALHLGQETIEDAKLANDYMKAYNDALKEMLEALQGESQPPQQQQEREA